MSKYDHAKAKVCQDSEAENMQGKKRGGYKRKRKIEFKNLQLETIKTPLDKWRPKLIPGMQ